MRVIAADAWTWDWTAVAAVATGALALFTAWLAFSTRSLAKATRQDVNAAWRPVLIGAADTRDGLARVHINTTPGIKTGTAKLTLIVSNIGTGPALNVKLTMSGLGAASDKGTPIPLGTLGPKSDEPNRTVVLAAAVPTDGNPDFGYDFLLAYEDLARAGFTTRLRFDKVETKPPFHEGDYNVAIGMVTNIDQDPTPEPTNIRINIRSLLRRPA
jgi:hypothetical protein